MAEISLKCKSCGHEVTAENEEKLIKKIQQHNKEHHDMDTSTEEARKAIQERGVRKE